MKRIRLALVVLAALILAGGVGLQSNKTTASAHVSGIGCYVWLNNNCLYVQPATIGYGTSNWMTTAFLQQKLDFCFGYVLKVDGIYGQQTKNVVTWFQALEGISADGVTGPTTWRYLYTAIEGPANVYGWRVRWWCPDPVPTMV